MKRFVKLVSVCLIALSVLALASCNSYGNEVAAAFRMEQSEEGATMTQEFIFKTDGTIEVNMKVKMGIFSAKGKGVGTYTVATGDVSGDSTGAYELADITISVFGVKVDSISGGSGVFMTTVEGLYLGDLTVSENSECMPRVK